MIGTRHVHARMEGLVLEQWNQVIPTTYFILQRYETNNDHGKYENVNNIILVWYNNAAIIAIDAIVTLFILYK